MGGGGGVSVSVSLGCFFFGFVLVLFSLFSNYSVDWRSLFLQLEISGISK